MKVLYLLLTWILGVTATLVLSPEDDNFYQPPKGFENAAPGTILRWRKAPGKLKSLFLPVDVQNMWQFVVRSTAPMGNALVIITTVIEPYNADPRKVVGYQVAQDSLDNNCAISYGIQMGSPIYPNLFALAEVLLIQSFLDEGAYIVTTDYEGLSGSFSVGLQAGQAVLDSLTGALKSGNTTGIDPDAKIGLFGYSGGAIAVSWAAAMQPSYSPHLADNLVGASFGGAQPNISATALQLDQGPFAGLAAGAINGLIQTYPALHNLAIQEIPDEEQRTRFLSAGTMCFLPSVLSFAFSDFFSGDNRYFKSGIELLSEPIVAEVLKNNTLALSKDLYMPKIPIYMFHSLNDEIAPPKEILRMYNNWCEWGIELMELNLDIISEHIVEIVSGIPSGINWLKGRLNGTEPYKGCRKQTRLTNLMIPGSISTLKGIGLSAIDAWMQEPIGPLNSTSKRDLHTNAKRALEALADAFMVVEEHV